MTYKYAMYNIACALDGGCHQVCNAKYRGYCTDAEIIVSVETLQELVGKADKYKWHDLRKNPDDLPKVDAEYDIIYSYRFGTKKGRTYELYDKTYGFHTPEDFTCIAWREIEPFEGVEE